MLYIFWYFHDPLVPIMTAVTFEENPMKKCKLIDEFDFLFTNYVSIHTQCDGSRLLEYIFCKCATNMVGLNGYLIF